MNLCVFLTLSIVLSPLNVHANIWTTIKSAWKQTDTHYNHTRVRVVDLVLTTKETKMLRKVANQEIKQIKHRRRLCFDDGADPSIFLPIDQIDTYAIDKNCVSQSRTKQALKDLWSVPSHAVTFSPAHHPPASSLEGVDYLPRKERKVRDAFARLDAVVENILKHNRTTLASHSTYTQLLRYGVNSTYALHTDCSAHKDTHHAAGPSAVPTRLFTLIVYLNTIKEGGETCFPNLTDGPYCVSPKAGRAVLFHHREGIGEMDHRLNCSTNAAHYTRPASQKRYVLQRFYFATPVVKIWADEVDDGVSTGDFGLKRGIRAGTTHALATVRCDGAGSCREYIVPQRRRASNEIASEAVALLHRSSAARSIQTNRHATSVAKTAALQQSHSYLMQALRLFSRAVQQDPFNAAVRKLLATAQIPLLRNKEAVRQIGQLRQQCIHSTSQALQLAPSDKQLVDLLDRLESGRDISDITMVEKGVDDSNQDNVDLDEEDETDETDETEEVCLGVRGNIQKRKYGVCNVKHRLPTLFLLGFQKCGTSSLHDWLIKSSNDLIEADANVYDPTQNSKELHFFNNPHAVRKGLAYYASHFQQPLYSNRSMYLDSTPDYIYNPSNEIFKAYGRTHYATTKFVFLIQRPEVRLVSWWNHFIKEGWIDDLVVEFKDLEHFTTEMIQEYEHCRPSVCDIYSKRNNWGRLSGVGAGMYGYWIEKWLETTPSHQIHVMFLSNVVHNGFKSTVASNKLFDFLATGPTNRQGKKIQKLHRRKTGLLFPNKNRNKHDEQLSLGTLNKLKKVFQVWNCHLKTLMEQTNVSHGAFPDWLKESCINV